MIESELSKRVLFARREQRDMLKNGWERVGEGGGKLWELERGGRTRHTIRDVRIAADGKSLWVKIENASSPRDADSRGSSPDHPKPLSRAAGKAISQERLIP